MPIDCRPTKLTKGYFDTLFGKITVCFEFKSKKSILDVIVRFVAT